VVLKTWLSRLNKLALAELKSLLKWTYKAYQRRTCISLFLGTIMSNCVSLLKRRVFLWHNGPALHDLRGDMRHRMPWGRATVRVLSRTVRSGRCRGGTEYCDFARRRVQKCEISFAKRAGMHIFTPTTWCCHPRIVNPNPNNLQLWHSKKLSFSSNPAPYSAR